VHQTDEFDGLLLLLQIVDNLMVAGELVDVTVKVNNFFSELRAELVLLHQCVQELEHGPHVVADLSFWNLSLVAN
jgi:hypothetical protein